MVDGSRVQTRAEAIGQPYADAFVTPQHRSRMRGGIAAVLAGAALIVAGDRYWAGD